MLPIRKTYLPIVITGLLLAGLGRDACAQTPGNVFQEAYSLILTNLPGMTAADLDRTAMKALVSALSPRVRLVGPGESNTAAMGPAIAKTALHDGEIGYVRVARVGQDFDGELRSACERLLLTNKLQGLVLDLRYAKGQSYPAVVGAADLFLKRERPLLDWGRGMVASKEKTNAFGFPVALLVNGETSGSAEAVAAVFRASGIGLVVGSPTSGQAVIAQEFKVSDGELLLIARAPLKLGDGTDLPMQGLKPDIQVPVNPEIERLFYADAFAMPVMSDLGGTNSPAMTGSTNRSRRFRVSEADLVRERREGFDPDTMGLGEPEKPVVRDPVLARALDVLKGLAVVRQSKT